MESSPFPPAYSKEGLQYWLKPVILRQKCRGPVTTPRAAVPPQLSRDQCHPQEQVFEPLTDIGRSLAEIVAKTAALSAVRAAIRLAGMPVALKRRLHRTLEKGSQKGYFMADQ